MEKVERNRCSILGPDKFVWIKKQPLVIETCNSSCRK